MSNDVRMLLPMLVGIMVAKVSNLPSIYGSLIAILCGALCPASPESQAQPTTNNPAAGVIHRRCTHMLQAATVI